MEKDELWKEAYSKCHLSVRHIQMADDAEKRVVNILGLLILAQPKERQIAVLETEKSVPAVSLGRQGLIVYR